MKPHQETGGILLESSNEVRIAQLGAMRAKNFPLLDVIDEALTVAIEAHIEQELPTVTSEEVSIARIAGMVFPYSITELRSEDVIKRRIARRRPAQITPHIPAHNSEELLRAIEVIANNSSPLQRFFFTNHVQAAEMLEDYSQKLES